MCIFFLFEFRLRLGARSTKRALVRISQLPSPRSPAFKKSKIKRFLVPLMPILLFAAMPGMASYARALIPEGKSKNLSSHEP